METKPKVQVFIPMPYVAKILRDKLLIEEKSLLFFEKNLMSENPAAVRQAAGSIPSCKHRKMELKDAYDFMLTFKKEKKEKE